MQLDMKHLLIPFIALAFCPTTIAHENKAQLVLHYLELSYTGGPSTFTMTNFPMPTMEGCEEAAKEWMRMYKNIGYQCVRLK